MQVGFSRAQNEDAFTRIAQQHFDALIVSADGLFASRRKQLVALTARPGAPSMYFQREFVDAGGLISYGAPTGRIRITIAWMSSHSRVPATSLDWTVPALAPPASRRNQIAASRCGSVHSRACRGLRGQGQINHQNRRHEEIWQADSRRNCESCHKHPLWREPRRLPTPPIASRGVAECSPGGGEILFYFRAKKAHSRRSLKKPFEKE